MAIISCPECGEKVSDTANVCIHCGAPLHIKNGEILIKCQVINPGQIVKVKIINDDTGEEILKIAQGSVAKLNITKDTNVVISLLMAKSTRGRLEYKGSHKYEISATAGILTPRLVLNEVTTIDSD